MIVFAAPWFGLALPLALLVRWLLPPHAERQSAINVPFFQAIATLSGQKPWARGLVAKQSILSISVLALCWVLVVGAMMRPQRIEAPIHHTKPTRDLLLLVDLSASMDTKDFTNDSGQTEDRLTAVKEVLKDFLRRRKGDRVGVVVFGSTPFPLVPFTSDLTLVERLLEEMQPGMAGPRTALGDAIGLGITLFSTSPMKHKTMIALTDGNDTASQVLPEDAARIARDRGITIQTVAIGDPRAVGEDTLNEATLRDVAQITGGGFFRALDRRQLNQIYDRLDRIETHDVQTISARPREDIYWWPLMALLAVSFLTQALRLFSGRSRRSAPALTA